ncbi:chitinase [Lasallia pustulata]|uniref:Chitinase n=1 Tax=Lasallia pustulata TaxID=136370 RepID=A0A1W5D7X3_9LECA|nr:chitinase [Lasallia pustulata]
MRSLGPRSKLFTAERSSKTPRIVCYHQMHYYEGKFVSMLPLLDTGVTHVIIAAIHINSTDDISLNDDRYNDPKNEPLWTEVRTLQRNGVKVLGMLGGAHQGSFTKLDGDIESFEAHYKLLYEMVKWIGLDGLDLDAEEAMSLAAIIRLIDRLKWDFGREFLITLASVATAMRGQQNLSGFDYEALEKAFAANIAWYNTMFYCGWGCMESTKDYDRIVARGWPAEKIVVGLVTNPVNCAGWVADRPLRETLTALKKKYPGFGGVMGWEYFNSMTEEDGEGKPWCWAQFMSRILRSSDSESSAV